MHGIFLHIMAEYRHNSVKRQQAFFEPKEINFPFVILVNIHINIDQNYAVEYWAD